MGKIVVTSVPGLDGEYDADMSYFTNREFHTIKQQTGLRAGELEDAFRIGDNDVIVALACVFLKRAGKSEVDDLLWDAHAGSVTFDFSDEEVPEEDARPPDSPTESGSESESAEEPKTSEENGSSGDDLNAFSVFHQSGQRAIGTSG